MSYEQREESRSHGEPIDLYLFKGADPSLESLLRSVTIIPGTTEFGYGTTKVTKDGFPNNFVARQPLTDFETALDELCVTASGVRHVSLVVAWHGTDLRVGACQIRPKVETDIAAIEPYEWQVGSVVRSSAPVVTKTAEGRPAVGGAPGDRSVAEALSAIKARSLRVTLYPFILMDIAGYDTLPDPHGRDKQPPYPWRGRITCDPAPGRPGTVDKTGEAATQVSRFFGAAQPRHFDWTASTQTVNYSGPADDWGFRRFILHMATIARAVGVDDFLIGSEMVGLTTIRSSPSTYPAVDRLVQLAADVRSVLGEGPRIGYAADWSEYHSHRPTDGSGDVFFHLDPLWASPDIDFVGIDNYFPSADWRDGTDHLDYRAGFLNGYARDYIQSHIEGGEAFDWFYASEADRAAQRRTPITDGAGKPWVFRNKDVRSWWSQPHRNRPGGVEAAGTTPWVPQSKPIVFTEIGCPSVNKGANQPNVFVDPKSSESFFPHFSNGVRDDAMQRAYLEAWLEYWRPDHGRNPMATGYAGRMIDWEHISVWTWDARPYPAFPRRGDIWGDAPNWMTGHWINGRVSSGRDFDSGLLGVHAYTDAERPVVHKGITYQPIPIQRQAVTSSGTLDKANLQVTMPQDTGLADLFRQYPPAQVVNLIIFAGHEGDDPETFRVGWTGRVLGCSREINEAKFTCEPISTSIRRPGLRKNYQYGCPHILYGPLCRASRTRATVPGRVVAVARSRVTLAPGWATIAAQEKFVGGMVQWINGDGQIEARTILRIENEGTVILLSGPTRGIVEGATVSVVLGCNHTTTDCQNVHGNILNYGGEPNIPTINPLGSVAIFY